MTKKLRCVVCASFDSAVPSLEALLEAGHEVVALVAREERENDTGFPEEVSDSELERWAADQGIQLQRPVRSGTSADSDVLPTQLLGLRPDLGIVVGFGATLPAPLREIPEKGWIKEHFSQLPKHRGLHPVRSTLWHGDRSTGVSIIEVAEEPDRGPILANESVPIEDAENHGELSTRLAAIGAPLLVSTVEALASGRKIKARTQNEKSSSTTPRFGRRHCQAPWWREAKVVRNHLRALSPFPGMTTMVRRERVRIIRGGPMAKTNAPPAESGTFIGNRSGQLAVVCGKGSVFGIEQAEWPEGTPISAHELVQALDVSVGELFV